MKNAQGVLLLRANFPYARRLNTSLRRNRAAGFDQLDNDSPAQIDGGNFIRAFTADERQLAVRTEGDMRRGIADREP